MWCCVFKQKTAYEMRISDWSSDVCSSDLAIVAAEKARGAMAAHAPYERQAILSQCVDVFKSRFEELAESLCIEAGKPIRDSRGEVNRLIDTFRVAAEEAVRINGESLTLEISPGSRGRRGFTKRVPIGVCRSEEHTSELQSLMRISYADFCLK